MALVKAVLGVKPRFGEGSWLAENATVVGDVKTGKNCTVWFNAVVRGDVHSIQIGDNVNIQDGAVIHCSYKRANTVIRDHVSIGNNAIVRGCTTGNNVLIGMGAIVMDHVVIGENSVIGAGAVVLENTIIPSGSIYAGVPAQKVRDIDDKVNESIERTAKNYPMYSKWFSKDA